MYSYPVPASTASLCSTAVLQLLPTNAATCGACGGPHSGRRIGPSSQSRANSSWGANPPIQGSQEGSDRQTGQRLMLESQAFLSIHLRDTDTGVKLDTNTTVQDFGQKYSYFYRSFLVFLIELDGICCAGPKSRVTLMSFQFCNWNLLFEIGNGTYSQITNWNQIRSPANFYMFPIFNFGHHPYHHENRGDRHPLSRLKRVSKYIFSIFAVAGITTVATKTTLSIKVFSISCRDYFFVNLSFTTPGQYGGEKYVISHNTGFNVIREDREIQLFFPPEIHLCGKIQKYSSADVYSDWPRDISRYQFL